MAAKRMISIAAGALKVEGIECERVLDIRIQETENSHGLCSLSLLVSEEMKPEDLLKLDKQKITVKAGKDILFCGILTQSHMDQDNNGYRLYLVVYSLSWLMDIERRTRTFQNPKKKLGDVLKQIVEPYNKGKTKAELTAESPSGVIERMLYQHDETDWEFLRRLAAEQGKLLFTDTRTDVLRVSIGCTVFKKQEGEKKVVFYRQQVSTLEAERILKNTDNKARTCYYVDTLYSPLDIRFAAGQTIMFDKREQTILSCEVVPDQSGMLRSYLRLRSKEGCRPEAKTELTGWSDAQWLEGKVLEVKGTDVKVQFACDKEQKKEEAIAIPYESTAANYLYCMPDVGDPVSVYAEPNGTLSAIGSHKAPPKKGGKGDGKGGKDELKPENRGLSSQGNLLGFRPEGIELLAAKKEKETIAQIDTKGITLKAKKNVIFTSKGNLHLQAAQGKTMDNQMTLLPAYLAGYAMYSAVGGQPPSATPAAPGGLIGVDPSSLKSAGAKLEKAERSELAKAWDKLIKEKKDNKKDNKKDDKKDSSSGASGGKLQIKAGKGLLLQVGDSSISLNGGNLEVKTRTLFQVGTGMAGAPLGSLSSFAGGSPKSRSAETMNPAHGARDRKRSEEGGRKTHDSKKISRGK